MAVQSELSSSFLDLQNDFCCSESNMAKLIRWKGCTPGVYQGSRTVFTASDLALCSWYQTMDSYALQTIELEAGEIVEASLDAQFLMLKGVWEIDDDLLESEKVIELGINKQGGYVGMTIPVQIGPADPTDYVYLVMKDLFILNSMSNITPTIKLNNVSNYTVTIGMFAAKLES